MQSWFGHVYRPSKSSLFGDIGQRQECHVVGNQDSVNLRKINYTLIWRTEFWFGIDEKAIL